MKKMLLFSLLSLGFLLNAEAQTKSNIKKGPTKKLVAKKSSQTQKADSSTTELTSTSVNNAFAPPAGLRISDPTINLMNQRAAGSTSMFDNKPVVGMPKSTYGVANGKILFRNTTAATSGTAYGSGAVGTGTSIAGTGTSESTIGVNGKSPNAGNWIWGDRRPVYTAPLRDSGRRQ